MDNENPVVGISKKTLLEIYFLAADIEKALRQNKFVLEQVANEEICSNIKLAADSVETLLKMVSTVFIDATSEK